MRVLEIASLAPAPFGVSMLADLGAEVVVIDRPGGTVGGLDAGPGDPMRRGRASVCLDLKHPDAAATIRRLVTSFDVFVEGFRPGVTERLGLGPDVLLAAHPGLIYTRMTGYGQSGPFASRAGHDINYLALSGALDMMGRSDDRPYAPLNLVADFGGGGMLMAFGVLAALYERDRSGSGQVIDVSMLEGATLLTSFFFGLRHAGMWSGARGENFLDGGAPYYDTYACADGRFMAVGAIEPQFYERLLAGLGLEAESLPDQEDRSSWPELRAAIAQRFLRQDRSRWESVFADLDACVEPVLSSSEAPGHPHHEARGTFLDVAGLTQPAPAPRFSRTPSSSPHRGPDHPGHGAHDVLLDAGFDPTEIEQLAHDGVLHGTQLAGG